MTLLDRLLRKQPTRTKSRDTEINIGTQAGNLLHDTVFTEVVDLMRARIIAEWTSSPLRDVEGREKLRLMIEMLNSIVKEIGSLYQTGMLAQKEREAEDKKKRHKQ